MKSLLGEDFGEHEEGKCIKAEAPKAKPTQKMRMVQSASSEREVPPAYMSRLQKSHNQRVQKE